MRPSLSPKLPHNRASVAGAWLFALICSAHAWPAASAGALSLEAFYFPRKERCTVMVDYAKSGARLRLLEGDARSLEIVRGLLSEWAVSGSAKCQGATNVTMLAVLIPGKDMYGRPDFSNRKNLLKLESDAGKLLELAKRKDQVTLGLVRKSGTLEHYK